MRLLKSIIGFALGAILGCVLVFGFGSFFTGFAAAGENGMLAGIVTFLFTFPGEIVTIGFFALCGASGGIAFNE